MGVLSLLMSCSKEGNGDSPNVSGNIITVNDQSAPLSFAYLTIDTTMDIVSSICLSAGPFNQWAKKDTTGVDLWFHNTTFGGKVPVGTFTFEGIWTPAYNSSKHFYEGGATFNGGYYEYDDVGWTPAQRAYYQPSTLTISTTDNKTFVIDCSVKMALNQTPYTPSTTPSLITAHYSGPVNIYYYK
jgi:hypothetical protein